MIKGDDDGIAEVRFLHAREKYDLGELDDKKSETVRLCIEELGEYFAGRLETFSVKLNINATVFEEKVYRAISEIPYGETRTYKQIARRVGRQLSYRAVGNALAKNPLLILLPCHRVVSSRGPGGYSAGLSMKKKLLELEVFYCASFFYRSSKQTALHYAMSR